MKVYISADRSTIHTIAYGYEYVRDCPLGPGQEVEIPLIEFTNVGGARFQPLATAVEHVIIEVPGHGACEFGGE